MQSTHYNGLRIAVGSTIYLRRSSDALGYTVLDIADNGFTLGIRQQSTTQVFSRQEIDSSYVVSVDTFNRCATI